MAPMVTVAPTPIRTRSIIGIRSWTVVIGWPVVIALSVIVAVIGGYRADDGSGNDTAADHAADTSRFGRLRSGHDRNGDGRGGRQSCQGLIIRFHRLLLLELARE